MMTCEIRIIGIKGSKSCKAIVEDTSIKRYFGNKYHTDMLINYGLCGQRLRDYYKKYPSAKKIPTINKHVGHSKFSAVNRVKDIGLLVPDSKLSLRKSDKLVDWIEKRFNSQGGYGICKARGRKRLARKYYQKFVKDRKYEMRVHAFKWINTKDWSVQKRHGKENEIAWNFNNGGYFSTVHNTNLSIFQEAIKISDNVLDILGIAFGAVDLIVDIDNNIYFIEVNSCPGFQELSKGIYVEAFEKLKELSCKHLMKYAD